ncbi:MAG: DUF5688 family protein [Porcincola intestinalis]|uniref:DUF5688 family protein n=1 Tax=Porcincola intestinalis TaxID=2606632 RepID=UPI002A91678F|nr:DUF5688 family protein [Porcincola intestinalis]MDY5331637.1 DUF5688 family protein [Porcincola intestinalis]
MMNFEDFCQAVERNVVHYLPPQFQEAKLRLQTNRKVNLGDMVGLTLTMPGSNIGPVIYLNDYYRAVSDGALTMGSALERIAGQGTDALENLRRNPIGTSDFQDLGSWKAVKDKVHLSAIGHTRNAKLLETVPHREMGDIACTYRINLAGPGGADGSILITNSMMETFGVNEQQLFEAAVENTLKNDKPTLNRMSDVFGSFTMTGHPRPEQKEKLERTNLLNDSVTPTREPSAGRNSEDRKEVERNWWEDDPEPDRQEDYGEDRDDDYGEDYDEDYDEEYEEGRSLSDEIPLLVLTTQSMVHGAAAIFIPDVMEQISKKMPEGFFILPSSIHEVMVLPKTLGASIEALDDMVSSINEMQVDPEDQLSDFAHVYDPDRKILLCPGAPELNKEMEKTQEKEPQLDPNVIR